MTGDQIRDLIRRYFEIWDTNQNARAAELYCNDAVWIRSATQRIEGKQKLREFYETGRGGVVEVVHTLDEVIVEGNRAACQGLVEMKTVDGKKARRRFADFFVVREGKIAQVRTFREMEKV